MCESDQRQADVLSQGLEITPAMLQAAMQVYSAFDPHLDSVMDLVAEIYAAMSIEASRLRSPVLSNMPEYGR